VKPFAVAASVLVWVVVVTRVRMLTKGGSEQRLLWAALAAIATGLTLDVPRVAQSLNELPGIGDNVSHLAKHGLAVLAAGAIWEAVRGLVLTPHIARRGRRGRAALTVGAATFLVVLFALAPIHDQPVLGLTSAAAGQPTLLAYWAIYLTAVGSALVGIFRVTLAGARALPPGSLRAGMRWIGAGAAVGLAYCAHKTFSLIASTATGGRWPRAETMERIQTVFVAAALVTVAVGVLWPAAVRWPVVRHLAAHRAHRRLYPLWRAYYEAEPAIALNPHTGETAPRRLRDIELRLYRRVIEIRDGMLAVRPFVTPTSRELALELALFEAEKADHNDPSLVAEAAWLELGRRAKIRGEPPSSDSIPATSGGTDLAGETRVLTRIARSHEVIQAVADRVEAKTETQTASP
jgi:hypothetical protein